MLDMAIDIQHPCECSTAAWWSLPSASKLAVLRQEKGVPLRLEVGLLPRAWYN